MRTTDEVSLVFGALDDYRSEVELFAHAMQRSYSMPGLGPAVADEVAAALRAAQRDVAAMGPRASAYPALRAVLLARARHADLHAAGNLDSTGGGERGCATTTAADLASHLRAIVRALDLRFVDKF